jgi:hypothetical protein
MELTLRIEQQGMPEVIENSWALQTIRENAGHIQGLAKLRSRAL